MFHIIRLGLIFLLGAAATQTIEDSPAGAFMMGAASVGLTIWMIMDISKFLQGVAS
jgi:hypothetical protein